MNIHAIKKGANNFMLWLIVFTQIAFFPVSIKAQTTEPVPATETTSSTSTTQPSSTTTQPSTAPKPPASPTSPPPETTTQQTQPAAPKPPSYVYNAETGLWENDKYTWSPTTGMTAPKTQQNYSYNPSTERWDTPEYAYSPTESAYVPNTYAAAQKANNQSPQMNISNTGPNSTNTVQSTDGPINASIDKTGPDGNTAIKSNNNSTATFNNFFDATISQDINSSAVSGNASVLQNTNGGNALTGDATAIANIINMLQSSWGINPSQLATFNANIDGDVFGDLTVDPGQLNKNVSASNGYGGYDNLVVNNQLNGQINNNVNLAAQSGNSTVAGNTKGGSATTGDATSIANVINMINSVISAGQSFVGSININGNLNGDILLPSWMKNQLLAAASHQPSGSSANVSNTGPNSNNTIDIKDDSSLTVDSADNIAINNNINSNAQTGAATVAGNTKGGNATTGNAESNVNIINLTGRQIVGANSLLVFVNVLGKWVGVIMDAPAGVTSGVVGNGVTQNAQLAKNTTINNDSNVEINNNIDVSAISGDAEVSNNTEAGNATSGNATTGVNIANIANSQLSFTGWFGVLFINVFGSWQGSFGVDTAAGNSPAVGGGRGGGMGQNGGGGTNSSSGGSGSVQAASTASSTNTSSGQRGVFGFNPSVASSAQTGATAMPQGQVDDAAVSDNRGIQSNDVLSDFADVAATGSQSQWIAPLITAFGMGALIVLIDRRWGLITGNK